MKKILFLIISLLVLSGCGADSRKSEQTAKQPDVPPQIQVENRMTPEGAVNNSISGEVEKLTSDYERLQVVLEVKKVKDKIKIYVKGDDLIIDRTEKSNPTYYVRIVPLLNEAKLIIDRFYADGSHLSKEITLKNGTRSEENEFIYESADDSMEKIDIKEGHLSMKANAPRYEVIYKDGKWSAEYTERELMTEGFEKIVALPEVKAALEEADIESEKIKKIRSYFKIRAEGAAEDTEDKMAAE